MNEGVGYFIRVLLEELGDTEQKIQDMLSCDPINDDKIYQYWDANHKWVSMVNPFEDFGTNITKLFTSIAISFCAIFFCIEFIKRLMKMEKFSFEDIFYVAYKFLFARFALSIGSDLLGAFASIGDTLLADLPTHFAAKGTDWSVTGPTYGDNLNNLLVTIENKSSSLGIIDSMKIMGTILIPLLAIKIVCMVCTVMAYGRLFELAMYQIIYPIPCCTLLYENGRIMRKFMLGYFALVLQGFFMLLSLYIFHYMTINVLVDINDAINKDGLTQGMTGNAFILLMGALIMLIGMTKSSSWARRMLGEE